jgi:hypothetical protein
VLIRLRVATFEQTYAFVEDVARGLARTHDDYTHGTREDDRRVREHLNGLCVRSRRRRRST